MTVHSFETSKNQDADPRWADVYQSFLPHYTGHDVVGGGDLTTQYKGIDHYVHQDGGLPDLTVDVKARGKWWGDCLLEIISNDQTGRWGWFLTAECDLIVSACLNEGLGWFIPLKRARWYLLGDSEIDPSLTNDKIASKLERFEEKSAKNKGYNTVYRILPNPKDVGGKWLKDVGGKWLAF